MRLTARQRSAPGETASDREHAGGYPPATTLHNVHYRHLSGTSCISGMRIDEVRSVDVRGSLTAQRGRLLSLLASVSDAQWAAPTAVDGQRHRLHLLDDDLSWLARNRDHHRTGNIPAPSGHEEFVRRLAQRNQRWIDSTQTLSRSCTTSKSGKRRGQPETITSKTTTCPWCCARSSGASAPIPSSSASWHHHRCADCRHRRLDVDQDRNRMGPR